MRRSEIPSSGEVEDRVGTTRSGVVSLAAAAAFFFVFPAAGLVAAVDFGLGFVGPVSSWWQSLLAARAPP